MKTASTPTVEPALEAEESGGGSQESDREINGHAQPARGPVIHIPSVEDNAKALDAKREEVTLSQLCFRACNAAEEIMPATSKALIEAHDREFDAWKKGGWENQIPESLRSASKAVEADPLANFVMDLRKQGNVAAHEAWQREDKARKESGVAA